jgi:hypothetical protein
MIDDLDEALRDLLVRDLPIANNEVDIAFNQPTRDWASRLSRPTLNLFMHDMRENNRLRTQQPYLNNSFSSMSATVGPNPVRLDVHYMVTAWANDPGDEHRLLGRTLMVLYRYHALPEEFRYGQLDMPDFDVLLKVAQYDQRDIRREIWSMLDNEMRPIIDLTLTLAVEPYAPWTVPLVRETELGFGIFDANPINGAGSSFTRTDEFYRVSGTVHSSVPFEHLSVQMLDLAVPVTVAPTEDRASGRYSIQNLRAGSYRLEVWTGVGDPVEHTIEVPSPPSEYDIYL